MTTGTLPKPKTVFHACECGRRIPMTPGTKLLVDAGEVVVCNCKASA